MQLRHIFMAALFSLLTHASLGWSSPRWVQEKTPEGVTLIYPEGAQSLGVIREIKESLPFIEKDLKDSLDYSIQDDLTLILDPRAPSHNGLASVVPDHRISIYTTPPYVLGSIAEGWSWTYETTLHEMTHIAHINKRRGAMKVLNAIFGSIVAPNGSLSTWIIEGLAVNSETKYSKGGRLRSSFAKMVLSEACRDGVFGKSSFSTLDQLTAYGDPWPLGLRPYLIGADFLHFTEEKIGPLAFKEYHDKTSGIFPYFWIFFKVKEDESWKKLWKEYTAWRNSQCTPRTESPLKIEKTNLGYLTTAPALTDEGIYFYRRSRKDNGIVYFWDKKKTEPQVMFEKKGLSENDLKKLAFDSTKKELYYSVSSQKNWSDYHTSNVYRTDFKKHKRVSREHAFDPAVSEDKRLLAYIHYSAKNGAGVRIQNLDEDKPTPTWACPPRDDTDFYQPVFTNDGDSILATAHIRKGGNYEIWECSLSKKRWSRFLYHPKMGFHSARPSPLGILVTRLEDYQEPKILTYTPGDKTLCSLQDLDMSLMFQPQFNGSTFVAVSYSNNGFDIARTEFESGKVKKDACMKLETPPVIPPETKVTASNNVEDYKPWNYLLPQFWVPNLYWTNENIVLGAATAMWDPLLRHQYMISASYDIKSKLPEGFFQYNYQPHPMIGISGAFTDFNDPFYSGSVRTFQPILAAGIQTQFALHPQLEWQGILGFVSEHRVRKDGHEPSRVNGIRAGVFFEDTDQTPDSLTFSGIKFSLITDTFHDMWGSENNFIRFRQTTYLHSPEFWHLNATAKISSGYIHVLDSNKRSITQGVGTFTAGGGYSMDARVPTTFLVRGYPLGFFRSSQIHVANLGLHFPIVKINRGIWLLPFFFERVRGEVVGDILTGDFFGYKLFNYYFGSAGVEIHCDGTIMYGLPATVTAGLYKGFQYGGEWQWRFYLDVAMF